MPWIALGTAAVSAYGAANSGPDGMPASPFYGGSTNWGSTWSVATSGSKASAVGSPSGGVDSWIVPVVAVAGLLVVLSLWKKSK